MPFIVSIQDWDSKIWNPRYFRCFENYLKKEIKISDFHHSSFWTILDFKLFYPNWLPSHIFYPVCLAQMAIFVTGALSCTIFGCWNNIIRQNYRTLKQTFSLVDLNVKIRSTAQQKNCMFCSCPNIVSTVRWFIWHAKTSWSKSRSFFLWISIISCELNSIIWKILPTSIFMLCRSFGI